ARLAEEAGVPSVSFTYNEPLVSWEYLVDASRVLKERRIPAIIVSNGLISEAPLQELTPLVAAANIDLKACGEEQYRTLGGRLGTVQRTIALLIEAGVHVEVTFLLVPGLNDEMTPFLEMVQWLSELSPQPVLHISRYFPNRRWTEGATPEALMAEYVQRASERLVYVYAGNGGDENSTLCRHCGKTLVLRRGFRVTAMNVDPAGRCMHCGNPTPVVMTL
ncbi:MAG TPA: AmmeMemoRadiSam system radical SAM enzyme, partial [Synergistaceae bacterium]|nr:AmmeMemoRadiSam system radical SAM enzyme [Synergistaceae bacterium]